MKGNYLEGFRFWMIVVMMKNMVVLADLQIFISFVGKYVYADRLRDWVMRRAR